MADGGEERRSFGGLSKEKKKSLERRGSLSL
jgi:hypothetical protein